MISARNSGSKDGALMSAVRTSSRSRLARSSCTGSTAVTVTSPHRRPCGTRSIPCPARRGVLTGDVLEVCVHHRRADPLDQSAGHRAVLDPPGVLGLGPGPVRIAQPVADMQVRGTALAARRVLAPVQIDQVQPAQLADPHARRQQAKSLRAGPGPRSPRPAASPALPPGASSGAGGAAPWARAGWPASWISRGRGRRAR